MNPAFASRKPPHSVPMKESSLIAIFGEKVDKPQQLPERPQSRTLATRQEKNLGPKRPPRFSVSLITGSKCALGMAGFQPGLTIRRYAWSPTEGSMVLRNLGRNRMASMCLIRKTRSVIHILRIHVSLRKIHCYIHVSICIHRYLCMCIYFC